MEVEFKVKPLSVILSVTCLLLLLFGCIESNNTLTPPFTEAQFYNRVTDLNYLKAIENDYNGMVLFIDENKISAKDINQLIIIASTIDTNIWTSGLLSDENVWQTNFNTIGQINSTINVGDNNLWIQSQINNDSCIYLMESSILGFMICNDGVGSNRLVFSSINADGIVEAFSFDRDTGEIVLTGEVTIDGNVEVDGNMSTNCVVLSDGNSFCSANDFSGW